MLIKFNFSCSFERNFCVHVIFLQQFVVFLTAQLLLILLLLSLLFLLLSSLPFLKEEVLQEETKRFYEQLSIKKNV